MLLGGCTTIRWYGQAASGQLELLTKREDIEKYLARSDIAPQVRTRLEIIQSARTFALDELALPSNGSYTHFVDLDRDAVLWNVIAAPEFDLAPKTWCYPFAGCLAYRGWFSRKSAEREARRLSDDGFDVRVAPVLAYSTLGVFDDPITTPMLRLPEWRLGGLLFHELAHQRVFVAGDTAFSEAYATAVEQAGLAQWLADANQRSAWSAWQAANRERNNWLLALTRELELVYAMPLERAQRRALKQACFEALGNAAEEFKRRHPEAAAPSARNNADLALVAVYNRGVGAFVDLLAEYGNDFRQFHAAVERLGSVDTDQRARFLAKSTAPDPETPPPPTFCPPAPGSQGISHP